MSPSLNIIGAEPINDDAGQEMEIQSTGYLQFSISFAYFLDVEGEA